MDSDRAKTIINTFVRQRKIAGNAVLLKAFKKLAIPTVLH
jgi:hypothetical protein